MKVIVSMYSNFKASVRMSMGLTEKFTCSVGTRQGCISPLFFFLFLFCTWISCLIYFLEKTVEVYMWMRMQIILQHLCMQMILFYVLTQLRVCKSGANVLHNFCKNWDLCVNIKKSKIMVFWQGGIVKACEKWLLNGIKLDIVSSYKYLGVVFTPTMK